MDILAYNEARLLRNHFQLIYGSAEAADFVFSDSVTGASLQTWLQTPANLTAFTQLTQTFLGPQALVGNTTTFAAVVASPAAMTAVAASSTAMAAVVVSAPAMRAVATSPTALAVVAANPIAMAAFSQSLALPVVRVPAMTSATAPSGVASASTTINTSQDPWRAFDRASSSTWMSAINSVTNQWLQYVFPIPVFIHSVDISGYDGPAGATRSVRDCSIQCSDDGSAWKTIISATLPASTNGAELRRIGFSEIAKHRYWRIFIANNHGDASIVGISEANFVGFDV
ncbi:discoidin domain-containing protein [Comamonas sp.]|uniref:discoidin domain-containing protein n=1 Tax=Comamonas sp. TaxID=34028 RepID=UPI0025830B16|nr:discoidin domain-containing protein [Comamonas sp.]